MINEFRRRPPRALLGLVAGLALLVVRARLLGKNATALGLTRAGLGALELVRSYVSGESAIRTGVDGGRFA